EPGSGVIVTRVALANAVLALDRQAIAFAEPRQVELNAAADGPAPLVARMAKAANVGAARCVKVRGPIVMRDGRDLRAAPSLIDPDRPDNVRNQSAGISSGRGYRSSSNKVENFAWTLSKRGEFDNGPNERRRVLNRDGRRHAVAELLRV